MYVCMYVLFENYLTGYLQTFWGYCCWKKSCTGAGIRDETLRHVPPHPLFKVVSSSPVRRCRMSVIQLLGFGEQFLPVLNGEHEGQHSKCVLVAHTFHQPYIRLAWTDLCCPHLFACVGRMLPRVKPMLAVGWPLSALRWRYVGLSWPYLGPMLAVCGPRSALC